MAGEQNSPAFFYVRPAGRIYLERQVLYDPGRGESLAEQQGGPSREVITSRTAVCGTARPVVWEDESRKAPSYPILK